MKNKLILIIFSLHFIVFSQIQIDISYGQKLEMSSIHKKSEVIITNDSEEIVYQGNSVNEYLFDKSGNFDIKVKEFLDHSKSECEHKHLPENFIVNVAPYRIFFDPLSVKLSDEIRINTSTSGVKLYVDITIDTIDKTIFNMNNEIVNSAGIGTKIKAKLDKKFSQLSTGKHTIYYNLEGLSTEASFIMFDFLEPNGNIQSIALINPIKN
jgi:hypothetical protein